MDNPVPAFGDAALHIQRLRRKGVHCRIREKTGSRGPYLEIVREPGHPADLPEAPPARANPSTRPRHARRAVPQAT